MTKVHDRLSWLVLVLIGLSPIPFGSNRPVFWAISGVVVGCFALYYAVGSLRARARPPITTPLLTGIGILFGLLCLFLLFQMLPLGLLLGKLNFIGRSGDHVMSNTLSLAPGSTWLMLVRMLSYGLLFFLVLQVSANPERANRMLLVILCIVAAHAAFGLIQLTQLNDTLLGTEKTDYIGSATGTFVNRNSYATFLAMGLSIGAVLLMRNVGQFAAERDRHRAAGGLALTLAFLIGLAIIVIALLATQSRMGFFVGMIGSSIALILGIRMLSTNPRLLLLGAFGFAVATGLLIVVFGQDLVLRVIYVEDSANFRSIIYAQVWQMILARPWLGYGGGSFETTFQLFHALPLPADFFFDKAHSTYLTLWSELGVIIGSIPMLIVLLLFLKMIWVYFWKQKSSAGLLCGIAIIVVTAVHSLVDFSLEIQADTYLYVCVIAIATASTVNLINRVERNR